MNIGGDNSQGVVHYHSVVFSELEPETNYLYRVQGADDFGSEWMRFRTASTETKPFRFVYFGDAQNDLLQHWSRLLRAGFEHAPDAAFALYCGDLVNQPHRDLEWAEWYKAGGWIHGRWTAVPVVGNHEKGRYDRDKSKKSGGGVSLQWRPQFTLPEVASLPEKLLETVYSFDYQGLRVIVLNSTDQVEAQAEYLESELKRPGANWTVVATHYSLFSPRENRDHEEQRNAWKPLLDQYGVDLVLQGHDHLYARGHVPVRTVDGGYSDAFQTLYVASVSGPKMYELSEEKLDSYKGEGYREGKVCENTQFFQVISIEGDRLVYKAYTATGELFDQVQIEKNFKTGAKRLF